MDDDNRDNLSPDIHRFTLCPSCLVVEITGSFHWLTGQPYWDEGFEEWCRRCVLCGAIWPDVSAGLRRGHVALTGSAWDAYLDERDREDAEADPDE